MKGLVDIEVTIPNSKVVYRLSLDRKVSILSGGSGSGKSVLRDFIEVCNNDGSGTLKRLISYITITKRKKFTLKLFLIFFHPQINIMTCLILLYPII